VVLDEGVDAEDIEDDSPVACGFRGMVVRSIFLHGVFITFVSLLSSCLTDLLVLVVVMVLELVVLAVAVALRLIPPEMLLDTGSLNS